MPIQTIQPPLIIDNPYLGRTVVSYKSYRPHIYLLIFIILTFLLFHKDGFLLSLFVILALSLGCLIVWGFAALYFNWYVTIENGYLLIHRPYSFKNKVNKYFLADANKIIWEIKKVSEELTTNTLWILNSTNNRIRIVEEFYMFENTNKWDNFIKELSEKTGLPVEKEIKKNT